MYSCIDVPALYVVGNLSEGREFESESKEMTGISCSFNYKFESLMICMGQADDIPLLVW